MIERKEAPLAPQGAFPPQQARTPVRHRLWVLASYAIAAACLYWIFHDLPLREVLHSMAQINWWWVPLVVALNLLVYVCAGWEWQLLMHPVGRLSVWQSTQTVFAGRLANDLLPVHAGYIIRVYLTSRWTGQSISSVLPALLIERLFDAFWLVASIGVTVLFFPLPPKLVQAGEVLGGLVLVSGVVLIWLTRRKRPGHREAFQRGWGRWMPLRMLRKLFEDITQGVHRIANSYLLPAALGLSIFKLALQGLAFVLLLRSYSFAFSIWVSLAVFLVAYVGISLPSTPASAGVFQVFCVAGLTFFGVSKLEAGSFALVAFVVLTVPLSIGGFIAFAQSGLTWRMLRTEVGNWKQARHQRAGQHLTWFAALPEPRSGVEQTRAKD